MAGSSYTITATASSGLPVSFSVNASASAVCSTTVAGVVTFQAVGQCVLIASQGGNRDFRAAPQLAQSFAVGQGTQIINISSTPSSTARIGQTYSVVAFASSGLALAFSVDAASAGICSVNSGGVVTLISNGTCTLQLDQAGNANFLPAARVSQTFEIFPIPPVIVYQPAQLFGESLFVFFQILNTF